MRVPLTHWARSLSGVQMITRSTRSSRAAAAAPAASASSASNSTIGQTTMPAAVRVSSSNGNCASRSGSMPSPVLYPGRGVLTSVLGMIKGGATHIAVATDHVIESFRNQLWPGYKTSEGIEPDLLVQFQLLEDVLSAAGIVVWPMVEFEADDALAAAA